MDADPELLEDDLIFYSLLYTSITVLFAMAVLTKFLTNEFRFGFRSCLSLVTLFIGEPLCHFLLRGPSGVALFGIGCLFIYSILPASHLPVDNKAVLITGCDSGFGHLLAKKLDSMGMCVFAGCFNKNGEGAEHLKQSCSSRVHILQLDVTDDAQIKDAVRYISARIGEEGLWGLVNNAGIPYLADLELTSDKVFHRILDVNIMGTVKVTRSCLPLIRQARGRIVNMSSITGKIAVEGFGAYSVSKHGIEAYSDVLRLEMKKWGVKVITIQPTAFKTDNVKSGVFASKKSGWENLDETTQAAYGEAYYNKIYDNYEKSLSDFSSDLSPVVRAIRSGLLSMRPPEKLCVGRGARTLLTVFPLLPFWIADRVASLIGLGVYDIKPAAAMQ